MSIVAIAHSSPASFSNGKYLGSMSSMLVQPSCLVILINVGTSQYFSKHQWTIDCLMRPLVIRLAEPAGSAAEATEPPTADSPRAIAPAAVSSTRRRLG